MRTEATDTDPIRIALIGVPDQASKRLAGAIAHARVAQSAVPDVPWTSDERIAVDAIDVLCVDATAISGEAAATLLVYLIGRDRPVAIWNGARYMPPERSGPPFVPGISPLSDDPQHLLQWMEQHVVARRRKRTVDGARAELIASGYALSPAGMVEAARSDRAAVIELFLRAGMSADTANERGVPALHAAIRSKSWQTAEALIAAGADLDLKSADRGATPLVECAPLNQPDLLARLAERTGDVDARNAAGQTALMAAVAARNEAAARILIDHGADATVTDALGMSAAKYATLFGLTDLVNLINSRS